MKQLLKPAGRDAVRFTRVAPLLLILLGGLAGTSTAQTGALPAQRPAGFLTPSAAGDPLDLARGFVRDNHAALGLDEADLQEWILTDRTFSSHNALTHLYLRQRLGGIEVHGGDLSVSVTADGRLLAIREDTTWPDKEQEPPLERAAAQMWSTKTWEPITPLMIPAEDDLHVAALSPDGKRVVIGTTDGSVELWDAEYGECVSRDLRHPEGPIVDVVFQADGSSFVTVSDNDNRYDALIEMRMWSTVDAEQLGSPMVDSIGHRTRVGWHPHGQILAVAGFDAVRLWHSASGLMLSPALPFPRGDLNLERDRVRDQETVFSAGGEHLYVETTDSLWSLPLDEVIGSVPADDTLRAWSEMLSGRRIDEAGGYVRMTKPDYQRAWAVIRSSK